MCYVTLARCLSSICINGEMDPCPRVCVCLSNTCTDAHILHPLQLLYCITITATWLQQAFPLVNYYGRKENTCSPCVYGLFAIYLHLTYICLPKFQEISQQTITACDCKVWSRGAPREISAQRLVAFQLSPELQKIQNDVLLRLRLALRWLGIPAQCFRNSSAWKRALFWSALLFWWFHLSPVIWCGA